MPNNSSASLIKLQIQALNAQGNVDSSKGTFKASINPDSYAYNRQINYNTKEKIIGRPDYDLKYAGHEPESLSFSLHLDGTGIVSQDKDIVAKIESLKKVVYQYDGSKHEPLRCQITWGSFIFKGRMEKLNINYTLFKPDATPLRAKLELAFVGYVDAGESSKKANKSSPDMSHIRTVLEGSSLPLMCQEIYGDESMYLEVAKANALLSFRKLEAGTQIYFPPIKKIN